MVAAKAAQRPRKGWKKGVAIVDLVLRLSAIVAGFAATSLMATTDETLPFFTQFLQFHAQYNDLPTFSFFLIANAITSGYLVLTLPFSIVCIVRPRAAGPRLLLIILDSVMMGLTTSAASASAAIVYLAHNGNSSSNWNAFCLQFNNFCQQVSSAVVASFVVSALLLCLVVLSAFALRKMK
ncbi:PREDICTED: casparian strip membrane protein 4-like [Populus euphratica]|nr:PREDICTED: casparian strip membrane protein 4-like [Populus euphratica]